MRNTVCLCEIKDVYAPARVESRNSISSRGERAVEGIPLSQYRARRIMPTLPGRQTLFHEMNALPERAPRPYGPVLPAYLAHWHPAGLSQYPRAPVPTCSGSQIRVASRLA